MQKLKKDLTPSDNQSREGWEIQKLSDEASQKDEDEIQRQILRGDESKGDPDKRDHAGRVNSNETPQGREETKTDEAEKANKIGK
jgi:hypothetical protein